jgi:uncharacterized OB-fold protein
VTVRLVASRCVECQEVHLPALDRCPSCWSSVVPLELSAHVVLQTYTVVRRGPAGVEVPYAIGVGAFPEGVRSFGRIVTADFGSLAVGQRLRVRPDPGTDSYVFSVDEG